MSVYCHTCGRGALSCECAARALTAAPTLSDALDDLQQAEAEYRLMHNRHGDGSQAAGRAWDRLRLCGNKARVMLDGTEPVA